MTAPTPNKADREAAIYIRAHADAISMDYGWNGTAKSLRRHVDHLMDRIASTAALEAENRALREAHEKIAAFRPKEGATKRSHIDMDNAWNRAGEYAAGISRAALANKGVGQS